jgi:Ca2+-binding EF-hand superfamily protein
MPSDEYFVKIMEQVWGVREDEEEGIFKDKVREMIKVLRQRLISIANGSQEEYVLEKIFKDFDLNGSGTITQDEMGAMMGKLGIAVEKKYVNALIRELDINKSGMLEFDEFRRFIIYDPYK